MKISENIKNLSKLDINFMGFIFIQNQKDIHIKFQ